MSSITGLIILQEGCLCNEGCAHGRGSYRLFSIPWPYTLAHLGISDIDITSSMKPSLTSPSREVKPCTESERGRRGPCSSGGQWEVLCDWNVHYLKKSLKRDLSQRKRPGMTMGLGSIVTMRMSHPGQLFLLTKCH